MRPAIILIHVLAASLWICEHLLLAACHLPLGRRPRAAAAIAEIESRFLAVGFVAFGVQALSGLALAGLRIHDVSDALPSGSPLATLGSVQPVAFVFLLSFVFRVRANPLGMIDLDDGPSLSSHALDAYLGIMLLVVAGDCLRIAA